MKKADFGSSRDAFYPYSSNPLLFPLEGQQLKRFVIGLLDMRLFDATEAEPWEKRDGLIDWNH